VHGGYKFNTRCQLHGENFDAFYSELRALANKCGFNYQPAPFDEILRDRIVLGIRDDSLRKQINFSRENSDTRPDSTNL